MYRYRLRAEDPKLAIGNTVCVVMQNPSEANESNADKSVQFLEKLIFEKDYPLFRKARKMIIVNQFAYIQKKGFEGHPDKIGIDNDRYIAESFSDSDIILLAWGKKNPYEDRKSDLYRILKLCDPKQVWKTKKHPSRGFYKDFLEPVQIRKV